MAAVEIYHKPRNLKRTIKLLVRLVVSCALIGFVVKKVDLSKLLQTVTSVSLEVFLLVCLLYASSQFLSAIKWRILARNIGIDRRFTQFLRAYVFGMFVNTFAFGTVGGDVARAVALKPERGQRTAVFASVIADRLHGLGVLLAIGCLGIIFVNPTGFPPWMVYLSVGGVLSIAIFWFLGPVLLLKFFGGSKRFSAMAIQAAQAFPHTPSLFAKASIISAIFHSIQIFMIFVIAQELGAPLPMAFLFATVPIVNTMATLPISIQGIGVRESLFLLLFSPLGVQQEQAVAFGAVWFVCVTVVSAFCGLLLTPDLVRAGDKILDDRDPVEIIDMEEARARVRKGSRQ